MKILEDGMELYDKLIADIKTLQMDMTPMALKEKQANGLCFGHSDKSRKTRDKRK